MAMEVTERPEPGNTTTLRIFGRVDSSVSKLLEQRVQDVISRDEHIVVDLAGMTYVSSAGLRSFIVLAKHARARRRHSPWSPCSEEVAEIFEICGLLELFAVCGTVDAAVAAFPRWGGVKRSEITLILPLLAAADARPRGVRGLLRSIFSSSRVYSARAW